uniref:Uncharacterized protein n=1 Tax=Chromera velia CCMP2878 TaxID=1169474 RepID=A0A0G4HJ14_9ALVE|eukprot:Cvel_27992.t1-p1 / transcript=Cvel_27992.t1 / gene=Cvel_27992 / organism=Chromera_velia_CCMP2878 / gene_product=hypothetical protein / transcript_product=hypothetical protein / location=Cvel_scaffold3586:246-1249(+) / protein_length=292 / sequence_SO=supercontig / SO=protein_coding / is_pseudo=false
MCSLQDALDDARKTAVLEGLVGAELESRSITIGIGAEILEVAPMGGGDVLVGGPPLSLTGGSRGGSREDRKERQQQQGGKGGRSCGGGSASGSRRHNHSPPAAPLSHSQPLDGSLPTRPPMPPPRALEMTPSGAPIPPPPPPGFSDETGGVGGGGVGAHGGFRPAQQRALPAGYANHSHADAATTRFAGVNRQPRGRQQPQGQGWAQQQQPGQQQNHLRAGSGFDGDGVCEPGWISDLLEDGGGGLGGEWERRGRGRLGSAPVECGAEEFEGDEMGGLVQPRRGRALTSLEG